MTNLQAKSLRRVLDKFRYFLLAFIILTYELFACVSNRMQRTVPVKFPLQFGDQTLLLLNQSD